MKKLKRMGVILGIVIIIGVMIGIGSNFNQKNYQRNPSDFYTRYIQEKLELPFGVEEVEVESAIELFADQELSLKAYVGEHDVACYDKLNNMGWISSKLPKQFITEHVLRWDEKFDVEMWSYNEKFDCMWLYVDDYYKKYGEKGRVAGWGTEYTYCSPNYTLCLFVPECNLLFYKEVDS